MEVIQTEGSRKGSVFYWIEKRAFVKCREYQKTICLKCRFCSNMISCGGRATLDKATNTAKLTIPHSCEGDELDIDICQAKTSLKRSAETTNERLRELFNAEMDGDENLRGTFSFLEIESAMYKRRRLNQPANPRTTQMTVEMMEDTENNPFSDCYLGQVKQGEDVAIILGNHAQIEKIKSAIAEDPNICQNAFVDGTFGIVPQQEESQFKQLLIFQVILTKITKTCYNHY